MGKPAYSKGSCRKVRRNPVRTKTWKLGEYGGNIKANVNESGTAVQIIHSDKPLKAGAYGRLFRWPLDKFELEAKLNDLTTSYYASKVIEWVQSVTKGASMNGRKADKIANKTRGVDVFVFMKNQFAGTEAEDDIDKISRKQKGRDIGGGTDMRTGLREKQYYFRSNGDATRFIKMVKKLGVMKSYRASYADSADEWPYKSKSIRLNPAPAGYHYMPDGRLMADSAHTKNPPPLFKSGGYIVVKTYTGGRQEFTDHIETLEEARKFRKYFLEQNEKSLLYRGRTLFDSVEILPHTEVLRNPAQSDPNLAYKKEYGWTFVEFLKKRLIPDLRESGMDATADDYQRGISLYRDKKGVLPITSSMNYLKYLRETLIPDLKASGSDSTAADFERMYKMVLYTIDRHPKSRGR